MTRKMEVFVEVMLMYIKDRHHEVKMSNEGIDI